MEKELELVYKTLQVIVGLHRKLLEAVRTEREVLVQADLAGIQNITLIKQSLIEEIHKVEALRLRQMNDLASIWKTSFHEVTLQNIIIKIQGVDQKSAEHLRSIHSVLMILIDRISDQNSYNLALIEKSLNYFGDMRKNILSDPASGLNTYSQRGQPISGTQTSRFISKEG